VAFFERGNSGIPMKSAVFIVRMQAFLGYLRDGNTLQGDGYSQYENQKQKRSTACAIRHRAKIPIIPGVYNLNSSE
jgi:hypothetical protein